MSLQSKPTAAPSLPQRGGQSAVREHVVYPQSTSDGGHSRRGIHAGQRNSFWTEGRQKGRWRSRNYIFLFPTCIPRQQHVSASAPSRSGDRVFRRRKRSMYGFYYICQLSILLVYMYSIRVLLTFVNCQYYFRRRKGICTGLPNISTTCSSLSISVVYMYSIYDYYSCTGLLSFQQPTFQQITNSSMFFCQLPSV